MKCLLVSMRILLCPLIVSVTIFLFSLVVSLPEQRAFAQGVDDTTSFVRVIHASPYIGAADVFVDSKSLLNAFRFAQVTDYVPVPAGVHKVQVTLVGKGMQAALITQSVPIKAGVAYTLAAIGATPDALGLQIFEDDNHVLANHTRVRLYDLSPDAGPVTTTVGENGTFNNVAYQQASTYMDADSGPCTFTVIDAKKNSPLSLSTKLVANTVTSIFTVGLFKGTPEAQLVAAQAQGIPALPSTGGAPEGGSNPFWLISLISLALASMVTVRYLRRTNAT